MRILTAVVIALSLVIGNAEAGVLDQLKAGEGLKIGFREDAAPFSYRDAEGKPAGYSLELCGIIAHDLKQKLGLPALKVEYVPVTTENGFTAIQKGDVELLCGATTATLSRREIVDFSVPTFIDGAGILYRADGPTAFEELGGHKVAVRSGTTTEKVLKEALAANALSADLVTVGDHKDGLRQLEKGEVAAYFADQSILLFLLLESDARDQLKLSDRFFTREPYALALPRGDDDFRLFVDASLSRLYRSPEIAEVFTRSFGKAKPSSLLEALYIISALPD
jgi:ABC-type amino acid transport substrate-binding protein